MRQKTEQETMAAGRQINLLVEALDKAKTNGGVWLNPAGHPRPKMYPNGVNVSPFNALIMALHTDAGEHKMPLYMTFNTTKEQNLSVMKGQKGVPFVWYNWDTFVNRNNPEDKISRDTYKALPESVQKDYRVVQKREVRTVFNLDQTTFPHKEKEQYAALQKEFGGSEVRGEDNKGLKEQVSHFMLTMRSNLVRIEHSGDVSSALYDSKKDTVLIPNAKNFEHYPDYAQDILRQIMLATGYEQRLARISRPTPEAMRQEALISELTAGIKMAELGLPAKISKENLEYIDYWKQELQENPCLIDILERDVNKALNIVGKAERGEKIEYTSKERQDLVKQLSTPAINSQECAILLDVIRRDGEIDPLNFRRDSERHAFLEKFGLIEFETEMKRAKADLSKLGISEEDKEKTEKTLKSAADAIVRKCTESMPEKWNDKSHNFFVHADIASFLTLDSKSFAVVLDKKSKIADIILPTGANLRSDTPGSNIIDRIRHAVMKYMDASYVRFFNADGFMGYKPDDNYFRNKDITYQEVKGWKLKEIGSVKFDDAILKANAVIFDQAQMMKDDNGKWAFYLKAHGEEGFAILPNAKDVNEFFTTIQHGDDKAINDLRHELSQKYYLIGQNCPERRFDIFSMDIPKEDIVRIQRANIFKTKEGRLLMLATIEDAGKQRPREIKQSQWQRLWLAPDMAAYKNQLAAKIYADVLHPDLPLDKGEYRKPARERPLDDEAQHSYVEKPQVEEAPKPKVTPRQETESIQEVKPKEETFDADNIRKPETQEKPKAESQAKTKSETQTKKEAGEESKNSSDVTLTPMTKQFLDLKQKHPDALLLFRCGDFYETYMQDAENASKVLGITLTKSSKSKGPDGKPLTMAGFPYHALDQYLPKLIRGGFRVAICDQLEPPQRQEQTVEHESPQQEENHSRRMRR